MAIEPTQPENRSEPHFWSWLLTKPVTLGLAGVIVLLTVFYVEEDLRGKLAWQRYHRQLQARGQDLNWNKIVPPPIPDSENIFAAPKMKDWFVKGGSGNPTINMGFGQMTKFFREKGTATLAKVTVVPIEATNGVPDAHVVLRFDPPVLSFWRNDASSLANDPASQVIPLIVMDAVPLTDAIRNLAAQGKIKYTFAAEIAREMTDVRPQPTVTVRWENISARHALAALLANYGFLFIENRKTGVALIQKDDFKTRVYVDSDVTDKLRSLIEEATGTNGVPYANGPQGIRLIGRGSETKTFRILLRASRSPSPDELKKFFPTQISVASDGTNAFDISLAPNQVTAADYIAWNNQFQTNFDLIREGLRRPSARIPGDFSNPYSQPIVNFVSIRIIAQTLGQRAQCYLLLGEPEKALHELTLLHEMNRFLEARPVTLVAAMIEVAISRLYADMIADGFRLGAWREPQLTDLQAQLAEVNLLPQLRSAFLDERAGVCRVLDSQSAAKFQQSFVSPTGQSFWQRLQDPTMLLATLAPRGWNQQNMVVVARLDQDYLDSFDAERQIFSPRKLDAIARDVQKTFNRVTPMNFLAAISVPNFSRACQNVAWTQTMVNEATVACALERYRAAHGDLPETLETLVPDYIKKLPTDVIGGQMLHYHRKSPADCLLYSVGWNETDDGGVAVRNANWPAEMEKGDWVWDPLQEKR
jgi:hypothetical protein